MENHKDLMPINPSIVSWARNQSGYSLEVAKEHFKKIDEWESGESLPSYPQLESMSDRFKIPIAVFFFPDPPNIPNIEETFRTISHDDFEKIPSKVRLLLRKARSMQISLSELNDGKNPQDQLLVRDLKFGVKTSIENIASGLRKYLGVSVEEQTKWKTADIALEKWRSVLNEYGVATFKDAFKEDNYFGFSLYDDEFPIIYVNNSSAKTRQIFTVFHEVAHLIFNTSGIDVLDSQYVDKLTNNSKKIEIICNRFAGEFLVPDKILNEELENIEITKESAEFLADKFSVSREVIFRKFLDKNYITQIEYSSAVELWNGQIKRGAGKGGDYYNTQISYLGMNYLSLAFEKYYQNRFNKNQLAEYLNVKPKNIEGIEERFLRKGLSSDIRI
ncbi:ImmA/IrrE family metallo-endopeptidase [Haliea sp. AH-315-K21]|uniref:HTH cro/C1-type domain-containing protein n=1 Tax=SAR86 cluster bacterium TaxID=2030880 RepID=A0A2A5CG79_9GAMM|nr:ImmA/IrrE family metallo-endopeptidase [Haliea sp. AH-315-K21]PCJ42869.1 MAG: hypothetical protein COA71_05080 [SAR86 cluster bacterium]